MSKTFEDATHQLRAPYTIEDVHLALRLLALLGGNLRRTHRALRDAGSRVSLKTIERWSQQQYPEVYSEMLAEVYREANLRSLARAMEVLAIQTEATEAMVKLERILDRG